MFRDSVHLHLALASSPPSIPSLIISLQHVVCQDSRCHLARSAPAVVNQPSPVRPEGTGFRQLGQDLRHGL